MSNKFNEIIKSRTKENAEFGFLAMVFQRPPRFSEKLPPLLYYFKPHSSRATHSSKYPRIMGTCIKPKMKLSSCIDVDKLPLPFSLSMFSNLSWCHVALLFFPEIIQECRLNSICRKGPTSIDNINTFRIILEECAKFRPLLHLLVIDLEKAFNTMNKECILHALYRV